MFPKTKSLFSRINWKAWTFAITTTSSVFAQTTSIAICDDGTTQKPKNNMHLIKHEKPNNNLLEWGMHNEQKPPSHNEYFDDITLASVEFSSNVQCALDTAGNLYIKYHTSDWMKAEKFGRILDVAITNDTIYLIDSKGKLVEFQYHELANKYEDPCIEKKIKKSEEELRKMANCADHRRKKSFSSMPLGDYHRYLKNNYQWESTQEFVSFLTENYLNNRFILNDECNSMYSDSLCKVNANDYRVFAISKKGDVYVRGDNQRGACGIGDGSEGDSNDDYLYASEFVKINAKYFDSKVVDVACGEDHTLFLTANGRIFSCGADNCMQCGLGWTKRKCIQSDTNWTQLGVDGFEKTALAFNDVTDIDEAAYFHEVPSYDEYYPRVICGPFFDDYKVVEIGAGDYHSACIVEPFFNNNPLRRHNRIVESDGVTLKPLTLDEKTTIRNELIDMRRVVTWGCSLCGQLGHCNYTNASAPKPVKTLEKYQEYNESLNQIVKVTPIALKCGKEHTVVLMEGHVGNSVDNNKMVFAFGNNRYNQVSTKRKAKHNSPFWIENIIPQKWSIQCIAAGNYQSAAFGANPMI